MELYELLIGLISGIKMQLTYCSQRWDTVVLMFCWMLGDGVPGWCFYLCVWLSLFLGKVCVSVCRNASHQVALWVCDKYSSVPWDMHVWMRQSCTEASRQWCVYTLNNYIAHRLLVSRQSSSLATLHSTHKPTTTCALLSLFVFVLPPDGFNLALKSG